MKELTKRNLIRSLTTLSLTLILCLGVFTSVIYENKPVFTLQTLIVVLASVCTGGISGAGVAGLFLVAGCLGLPVFPGYNAGFYAFTDDIAGLLCGYFIAALISGLIAGLPSEFEKKINAKNILRLTAAVILGFFIINLLNIFWFYHCREINFFKDFKFIFENCIRQNIINEILNIVVVILITSLLRPVLGKLLYPEDKKAQEEKELFEALKNKRK